MECPNCKEEPISIFKRLTGGVGFWKNIRGYVKCIHCQTMLKVKLGKPFWIALSVLALSIITIYVSVEFRLFEWEMLAPEFFMGVFIVMLASLIGVAYSAVLCLHFQEVQSPENL